jgi:hypothetical protein
MSWALLIKKFGIFIDTNSQVQIFHSSLKRTQRSIRIIGEAASKKFGPGPSQITFVELDWAPISGGPLGENVLGIFYQESVPPIMRKVLENDLGWEAQESTMAYVSEQYKNSANPWETYLFGTYAHELAHVYFGFGKTRQKVSLSHEIWFSLGMGMVYDIEVTNKVTGSYPEIFADSDAVFKKYAFITDIDQRLVNPKTDNDKKYSLDRKKIFAHSKAHLFLSSIRKEIGEDKFDRAAREYVQKCSECVNGYEDFKKFLRQYKNKIEKLDKVFKVYS